MRYIILCPSCYRYRYCPLRDNPPKPGCPYYLAIPQTVNTQRNRYYVRVRA